MSTLYAPWAIETDIQGDLDFFMPYIEKLEWVDTNVLYGKYDEYEDAMQGGQMVDHYIKHLDPEIYDRPLKKFVVKLFKELGVKSQDWRGDFFLTKAGGHMPMHIDKVSHVALLLPLTENTGPLVCEQDNARLELTYQNLAILNTRCLHGVSAPTSDRLLFRLALHDVKFEELGIYKELVKEMAQN